MRAVPGRFRRGPLPAWKGRAPLILRLILLVSILALLPGPVPAVRAEDPYQSSKVDAVLSSMTPEERVGQLFLVTFQGTDTGPESQIYDLIANCHVGGVVLLAENDNFIGEPDTVSAAQQLINSLQSIEAQATPAHPTRACRQPITSMCPCSSGSPRRGMGPLMIRS